DSGLSRVSPSRGALRMAHDARPSPRYARACVPLLLLVLAVPACRVTDLWLWHPGETPPDAFAVERVQDVAYHDGPDAAGREHHLDLYLPRGLQGYPVVVLVHGG